MINKKIKISKKPSKILQHVGKDPKIFFVIISVETRNENSRHVEEIAEEILDEIYGVEFLQKKS